MRFSFKQKIAAVTTVLVIAGGGGAAYAFWSAGGTGSGTASTAAGASGILIHQTTTITDLAPGVAAEPLSGNFDNSNPSAVQINQVTAAITVTPLGTGLCTTADYLLVQPTATNALVPAGLAQGSWTGGSLGFNNSTTANQDGCKGATVNITYTSN